MADLGGLGAKEGAPVHYTMVLPSHLPALLPWLGLLLLLLLLKPNRCARAWWILVPLGLVAIILQVVRTVVSSSGPGQFCDLLGALAFGLAGLWLLAPWLRRRHRLATGLLLFVGLAGLSGLSWGAAQGCDFSSSSQAGPAIVLLITTCVIAPALTFVGWLCRNKYSPLRFLLWLAPVLVGIWLALDGVTVGVIMMLVRQGAPGLGEFLVATLLMAGLTFALLLPYLLLSFVNGLYRERLKSLLHVATQAEPPVLTPVDSGPVQLS